MIIHAHYFALARRKPDLGFHFFCLSPEVSDKQAEFPALACLAS
jgi:hypothetical protein